MERSIETDHLRNVRPGADAGLDECDLVGQVVRGQRDQRTQTREGFRRHLLRATEALPTMHHSVHDPGEHPCDQVSVDLVEDAFNRGCGADADHRPLAHVVGTSLEREHRVFDARRAAVDGEHEWGLLSHARTHRSLSTTAPLGTRPGCAADVVPIHRRAALPISPSHSTELATVTQVTQSRASRAVVENAC